MKAIFKLLSSYFLLVLFTPACVLAASSSITSSSPMPQGLWQAFSRAQHQVEAIKAGEDGYEYWAQNPGSQLRMRFGRKGLLIEPGTAGEAWRLAMQLTDYGQADSLAALPALGIESKGDRVSIDRGVVEEWYINKPGGLEQGFTLQKPADFVAHKPLILAFTLNGDLHADWRRPGEAIAFNTATGDFAFSYSKLRVFDANGQELSAQLALLENGLQIQISTPESTAWPVTVDPVFTNETKLSHDDNHSTGDKLGASVAVSYTNDMIYLDDWVMLGAPYDDCIAGSDCGAVYVFRFLTNDHTWVSYQKKLIASDLSPGDHFGHAISMANGRMVVGAPAKNGNAGEVYLFGVYANNWSQSGDPFSTRFPAIGIDAGDFFGWSVATDGNKAVVGAKGDEDGAYPNGAVHVVTVRSPYVLEASLASGSTNAAGDDEYGYAVSISDVTVAVGAPGSESAYVYLYNTDLSTPEWTLEDTFDAPRLAFGFGTAVAYFETPTPTPTDALIVGAPLTNSGAGDAFVYVRNTGGKTGLLGKYGWGGPESLADVYSPPASARFGEAVAIYGTYATVGAPGVNSDEGRAYRFSRGTSWGYAGTLTPGAGQPGSLFGSSVAMDQNRILVGSPGDPCFDGSLDCGSAYLYNRLSIANYTWFDYRKSYSFGQAIALHGDTAVVGADWEPCNDGAVDAPTACGAVYIFNRVEGAWTETQKLVASDSVQGDGFGHALALSAESLLVNASGAVDDTINSDGKVYAYSLSNGVWGNEQQLGLGQWERSRDQVNSNFGEAMAISGDTAIIGAADEYNGSGLARGAAYIYVRDGAGNWAQQERLLESDLNLSGGLGDSVDISGDIAVAGAMKSLNGIDSGEVYVFERSGNSWSQVRRLYQDDPSPPFTPIEGDHFGISVAIDGETVIVGADGVDNGGDNQGAAYVYQRDAGAWPQVATLTASDAGSLDYFGRAVSLENNTAVITSVEAIDQCGLTADFCGATYVFTGSGANWKEQAKLQASIDVKKSNFLGVSVSISGDTILTGADPWDDCSADFNCGHAFINRFNCGFGGVITAGRWTQIGIPCDTGVPEDSTVSAIFGDDLDMVDYGTRWILYQWNPGTAAYEELATDSVLELGTGYWIKSLDDKVWDVEGDVPLTSYTVSSNCSSSKGCFEITLEPPATNDPSDYSFNFVSNPSNIPIKWSDVRVEVGGTAYTPDEAFANSFIRQTFTNYNGNAYDAYDAYTPGTEGELQPFMGFWVKALWAGSGETVKLLIPNGSAGPPDVFYWQQQTIETDGNYHWSNSDNWWEDPYYGDNDAIAIPREGDEANFQFASSLAAPSGGVTIIYEDNHTAPLRGVFIENTDDIRGAVNFKQYNGSAFKAAQVNVFNSVEVFWQQYGGSFDVGGKYSPGVHELYGGTLSVTDLDGDEINQSGGLLNVMSMSPLSYSLSGGTANADEVVVGRQTYPGYLSISGGHMNVQNRYDSKGDIIKFGVMKVGSRHDYSSTVEVSGTGWLSFNPVRSGPSYRQEFNGLKIGTWSGLDLPTYFNQDGSSLVEVGHVAVGSGSEGVYLLNSGRLEANELVIGHYAQGFFTQNGGEVEVLALPSLFPGPEYDQHAEGRLRICIDPQGNKGGGSEYTLNNGSLTARISTIGEQVGCDFTQSGGTHDAEGLTVKGHGTDNASTYYLKGGSLNTTTAYLTGTGYTTIFDGSPVFIYGGRMIQTAGTHTVADTLSVGGAGSGSYTLSNGELTTLNTVIGSATYDEQALFWHISGTHNVCDFSIESPLSPVHESRYRLDAGATLNVGTIRNNGIFENNGGVVNIVACGQQASFFENSGTVKFKSSDPVVIAGTFINDGILDTREASVQFEDLELTTNSRILAKLGKPIKVTGKMVFDGVIDVHDPDNMAAAGEFQLFELPVGTPRPGVAIRINLPETSSKSACWNADGLLTTGKLILTDVPEKCSTYVSTLPVVDPGNSEGLATLSVGESQ
jgi:hypothetical protein